MYTGHHRTNVIKNGVLSFIIYVNGTKLNAGATGMKSQAFAPIWLDGPCLSRLQPVGHHRKNVIKIVFYHSLFILTEPNLKRSRN